VAGLLLLARSLFPSLRPRSKSLIDNFWWASD
jgi:hypothetical protein